MTTKLAFNQIDGNTVNVKDYGAVGDGVTDDTAAFNSLTTYLASISHAVEIVIPTGLYKINPFNTNNPYGGANSSLIRIYNDGNIIRGPGKIIIDDSVDYTAGFSAGTEEYWSVVLIEGNDTVVDGLMFDGNGTHTAEGYNPSIVNVRWQMVGSFGSFGNHKTGNKVLNCQGVDYGGQACSFQYQDACVIAYNKFYNHSGMGVSVGKDIKVIGNSSKDCYDAPYPVNGNVSDILIQGNYSDGNSNGSGLDIVGATDVVVCNNIILNSNGSAVHVTYSAQQSVGCTRIKIHDNIFKSNARYAGSPLVGEVKIGRDSNTANSANDVTVEDNIIIIDGSLGSTAGRALITNYGVNNLSFKRNKIYGTPNSSNVIALVQQAVSGLEIEDNEWLGDSVEQGFGIVSGASNTDFSFSRNRKIAISPSSSQFNNKGVLQDDGSVVFNVFKNIGTSATDILNLTFNQGAFEHVLIEVTAVQLGEFRGVAKNTITARGFNGAAPTILANTSDIGLGNNPPTVTTSTSTGAIAVKLASTGSAADSTISIRVLGKQDNLSLVF